MDNERYAKLYRDGRSQIVRIPRAFEFPEEDVVLRKIGDKLIIEPAIKRQTLRALLASWESLEETFPEAPELPHDPPPKL